MAEILLNTIALEPNRWAAERRPHRPVVEIATLAREAGFEALELWQYHATVPTETEVRTLAEEAGRLAFEIPVLGAYPVFTATGEDERVQAELRETILARAQILGCDFVKFFLGRTASEKIDAEGLARTVERLARWREQARAAGIRFCAELHGGTLCDTPEAAENFLADHPELELEVCYQPFDFSDTEVALELADRFAGKVALVHLQGKRGSDYCPLAEAEIDYRRLLPRLREQNPRARFSLEFVEGCIQPEGAFEITPVLDAARRDADFVRDVLGD
jgi:3-dehydroshikimate dehydratase